MGKPTRPSVSHKDGLIMSPEPAGRLDYVELGFKRNSQDRTTWRSAGIRGAPCPISCPSEIKQRVLRL